MCVCMIRRARRRAGPGSFTLKRNERLLIFQYRNMASTNTVEEETALVVQELFDRQLGAITPIRKIVSCPDFRPNKKSTKKKDDESFDATLIAEKIEELSDLIDKSFVQCHVDVLVEKAKGASPEQVIAVFSQTVNGLCKPSELDSMSTLQVATAMALYAYKKSPELSPSLRQAMTHFLNTDLKGWVQKQGGWMSWALRNAD
ncbi:uncharacterized protein LOC121299744 isoform X2 [Polyodon spathula]|uniref:uncharacterized protein LOC121299602 n=1 Tax=Polyodon spathula TaxID=7913 RepID=UPI001B7F4278|nr:uncharacterized protein LOC121299602 [Polyodon spathula]XP_041083678.1 uncharacterized protein LOC121299744 isoform X2 [Polyodon spathula]